MANRGISTRIAFRAGLLGAATLWLSPGTAFAQTSGVEAPGSAAADDDEIIVTAQKREERLQSVPISISVIGGEDLDRSTSQGVSEELSYVPGVSITPNAQNAPQITIRGVSAPGAVFFGASPVAYYLDSVPFGFVKSSISPDAGSYDLDRVEVLRGPQGTLYGASAQSGVVRILTKDPDLTRTEAKARVSGSTTKSGAENFRGDAALNIPLIDDRLAVRLVGGYQDDSGWIDRPNDKNANDAKLLNLRAKVKAKPTDNLTIGLSSWISRSDYGAPPNGTDANTNRSSVDESITTDFDSFGLTISYDFPSFSVKSSTSYLKYKLRQDLDSLFNGTTVLTTRLDADVFAQEVNLVSTGEGPWRWALGGIYRDAEDRTFQIRRNQVAGGVLTGGYLAPADFSNTSKSYAVFGEITRLLADDTVEITGGLRYFSDDVGAFETSRLTNAPASLFVAPKRTFRKVSPRAVLTWHASPRLTTYASYSEGFRSGADQNPTVLFAAPTLQPAKPDNLKNYEVGAKGSLFDGAIRFDAAVYYMDWQDVQTPFLVNVNGSNQAATLNGKSASGIGVDLGLIAKPTRGLTFGFTFSMNDLTQDADVVSGVNVIFKKGERLNLSPKYTIGGNAAYEFPLGNGGLSGRISGAANYTSERTAKTFVATSVTTNAKPLFIARAAISIESEKGWSATLFADNLTNENNAIIGVAAGQLPDGQRRLRPRTFGLQLEFRH